MISYFIDLLFLLLVSLGFMINKNYFKIKTKNKIETICWTLESSPVYSNSAIQDLIRAPTPTRVSHYFQAA